MKNNNLDPNKNPKLDKKPTEIKPYTTKRWLFYMLIPTLIMLGLTFLVLKGSMYTKAESYIGYNELGNIDYKVYLKDNNYYQEQYLDKDMQYIASIIKNIVPTFTYEMHSEEKMEYTYNYKVTADLIISDPNDNNKVLYKKPSVLLKDTKEKISGSSFRVDKDISINYDEYNNYVNAFKKEYALSVNSKLVLTFTIDVEGKSSLLKEDFNKTSKLVIAIPMSEQTINIGIDTSDINNSGTLERNYMSQIKKPVALVLGIIVGILSLALLYIVIYNFLTNRSKKDIYKSTVRGILREYDRAIVSSKSGEKIDESKYEIIEVPRIEELLDAHDSTGKPILYSEDTDNDISTFIIISDELLYKFKVVRKEVEEQEAKRVAAKNQAIEEKLSKFAIIGSIFKKKENENIDISNELNDMLSINESVQEDNEDIVNEVKDIVNEKVKEEPAVTIPEIVDTPSNIEINIPKVKSYVSPTIDEILNTPKQDKTIEPVIVTEEVKNVELKDNTPSPAESEKVIVKEKNENIPVIINEVKVENNKTNAPKKKNKNKYQHQKNNYYKSKKNNHKKKKVKDDIDEII